MAKFILGKKIGMSRFFTANGHAVGVTVVEIEPNVVVQVKTREKDGYQAVQLGTGTTRKLAKAQKGHVKDLGNFSTLREYRDLSVNGQELKVGDKLDVSMFAPGDAVKVAGVSKGKGFQGAVKRHGFHGMPKSHGHRAVQRHIGSIGQRFPQHTLKGKRMAGRMGGDRTTIRGLEVVVVDAENNLLAIKGAVPGNRGSILEITTLQ
jgi:large subunit ribosomal protein L3